MKKIFYTMAVAATLFAGYSAYNTQNSNELSDIALANVEALANNEGSDGNMVTCYSSSDAKKGSTYYDCGDCKKHFNSTGVKDAGKCKVKQS